MTTSSTKDELNYEGLIANLEYAACGQGPDAEETLYWKARNAIRALSQTHSVGDGKSAARGLEERNKVIETNTSWIEWLLLCAVPISVFLSFVIFPVVMFLGWAIGWWTL